MAKGQGLSMNVIVMAIIAIIVLLVLATLVVRQGGEFNTSLQSCDICVDTSKECTDQDLTPLKRSCTGPDERKGEYCCLGKTNDER